MTSMIPLTRMTRSTRLAGSENTRTPFGSARGGIDVIGIMGVFVLLASLAIARSAAAQLVPGQVLVVYDSRVPDSRSVAEYYAGSAKVPGGAGSLPGVRPGVLVVDLAGLASGGLGVAQADVTYAQFVANFRDPLRTFLNARGLATKVRCLVMTKGLPHRVLDVNAGAAGDNPNGASSQFNAGNATFASVDSELTLIQQNLTTGENNGSADSPADGMILNPYARIARASGAANTRNITVQKMFNPVSGFTGQLWRTNLGSGQNSPTGLSRGDFYLVTRLDGRTVADVRGAIDRAQNLIVNVDTATFVLDNDGQGLDNQGPGFVNFGPDYQNAASALTGDGRLVAANVLFNNAGGAPSFVVGPRISYGSGLLVSTPVLLIASVGSNANGVPTGAGTTYAQSLNYAPGAVFNTIESYNCRDFGGLGQNVFAAQQQAADFLIAGGTFAVGNVWEPFAWTIPDNQYLVPGFFLGNLSWAEAAYSGLPVLSWQQIVIGDPLARVVRSREDIDGDGRMTVNDLYAWPGAPVDLNRDGSVNEADYMILENAVRTWDLVNAKGEQR